MHFRLWTEISTTWHPSQYTPTESRYRNFMICKQMYYSHALTPSNGL
jgi:hypothetical protein